MGKNESYQIGNYSVFYRNDIPALCLTPHTPSPCAKRPPATLVRRLPGGVVATTFPRSWILSRKRSAVCASQRLRWTARNSPQGRKRSLSCIINHHDGVCEDVCLQGGSEIGRFGGEVFRVGCQSSWGRV